MPGPHALPEPTPEPPEQPGRRSLWSGALLEGRYRVDHRLGKGGMADVFEAIDERCNRKVVIKAPKLVLQDREDFRKRFENEIRRQTELDHPRIAKVLDRGEYEGVPFVVIQHLGGGSLAQWNEAEPRGQTVESALSWLPDVADALDHVHARGLVHRDVKPGNILFDEAGNVFLSDFGIAKAPLETDPRLTLPGVVLGTPGYVAPELGLERQATPASDQYALATTVYEALSGELPFGERYPVAMLAAKSVLEPRPLVEVAPEVPLAVSDAVMQALSRDANARYPSCRAFADALRTASRPVAYAPPSMEPFRIPAPWLLFPVTAGLVATAIILFLYYGLHAR